MFPMYSSGDHVLTFNWIKPEAGDVIIFRQNRKAFIKRIAEIQGDLIFVSGDNVSVSAKLDPIKKGQIIGKVILKY